MSYSTVSPVAARHSITFMAPSKTFNIAGLGSSVCHIADATLRNRFFGWLDALGVAGGNIFAFTAAEAAFAHGEEWQRQMLEYLNENVQTLEQFLKERMPKVKAVLPEASYLAWLDFSGYGLTHEQLKDRLLNEAQGGPQRRHHLQRVMHSHGSCHQCLGGEGQYRGRQHAAKEESEKAKTMKHNHKITANAHFYYTTQ